MGVRVILEGYGGQGTKSAGDLLADTFFHTGTNVRGMPIFSPLQMGGLIIYSLAVDADTDRVVPTKERDVYVMMHRCLFDREHADTVKVGGLILLNAPEIPDALRDIADRRIAFVDGDTLARTHGLVRANVPVISTVMAGAFARVTDVLNFSGLERTVRDAFPNRITENLRALRAGYENVRVKSPSPTVAEGVA